MPNKGSVAKYLAASYKLPAEQIATIGDMPNDVLMFAHSGLSIAMGNANHEVQRAAPLARMAAATCSPRVASRPDSTTWASRPARASAAARPMPLVPPVTRAADPLRSFVMVVVPCLLSLVWMHPVHRPVQPRAADRDCVPASRITDGGRKLRCTPG